MANLEIPDDGKVGLMGGKTKHDEISISSTEHMLCVGIVVRSSSLLSEEWDMISYHIFGLRLDRHPSTTGALKPFLPDEIHDFVLSFSRNIGVR